MEKMFVIAEKMSQLAHQRIDPSMVIQVPKHNSSGGVYTVYNLYICWLERHLYIAYEYVTGIKVERVLLV